MLGCGVVNSRVFREIYYAKLNTDSDLCKLSAQISYPESLIRGCALALHLKQWAGRKFRVVIPNHLPEIVRAPWGSTSPWRSNRERVIVESTVPFAR